MGQTSVQGIDQWGAFYRQGRGNVYPDENLVRLVRGKYADIPRSGRALDVGFEVSQDSIEAATQLAEQAGVTLQLGQLSGTHLPYPDGHFDLVISWGAVYYYGSRTLVTAAIQEFHRVIRDGGVLLMSVIHPNSFMVRRFSGDLGDGAHQIDREDPHDNRFGMTIFYDGSSSGWRRFISVFEDVE